MSSTGRDVFNVLAKALAASAEEQLDASLR
ncbi:hypothetical protein [Variovorax paradoxus]